MKFPKTKVKTPFNDAPSSKSTSVLEPSHWAPRGPAFWALGYFQIVLQALNKMQKQSKQKLHPYDQDLINKM